MLLGVKIFGKRPCDSASLISEDIVGWGRGYSSRVLWKSSCDGKQGRECSGMLFAGPFQFELFSVLSVKWENCGIRLWVNIVCASVEYLCRCCVECVW